MADTKPTTPPGPAKLVSVATPAPAKPIVVPKFVDVPFHINPKGGAQPAPAPVAAEPQSTVQTNSPRRTKRVVAPPLPSGPQPLPAGWFQIGHKHPAHKGTKETAAAAIVADGNIPAHWKTAILHELQTRAGSAFEVHATGQEVDGKYSLSITVKPLF